jgi:hypothetical protein
MLHYSSHRFDLKWVLKLVLLILLILLILQMSSLLDAELFLTSIIANYKY